MGIGNQSTRTRTTTTKEVRWEAEESNDDILTRARQSWHVPFYFPDHVHQTDRLRGLSVCIWESRKYGRKGRRLVVVIYYPFPSLPLSLSLSSIALSFLSLALPIYTLLPSVVDVSWALIFSLPISFSTSVPRIVFHFLVIHPTSSPTLPTSSSSSYLSAKISWSDVETDEEMNKTTWCWLHKGGPGKGGGLGRVGEDGSFILEHKLDGSRDLMNAHTHTR